MAFVAPALCYLAAWRLSGRITTAVLIAALALHAGSLLIAVRSPDGWRFGFASILSATVWVGMAVVWLEALSVGLKALRGLLLPVAALVVMLPLAFPGAELGEHAARPLFVLHLLAGTLAYGVLALAALHAVLMAVAERALQSGAGEPGGWTARMLEDLPPLLRIGRAHV